MGRLLVFLMLLFPFAGRAQVVISQIYAGGGSSTGSPSYTRDYVEIFNRGASAVNIGGYSIQYASATGTTIVASSGTVVIPAGVSLAPGQYYSILVGSAGSAGATLTTPAVDQVGSTSTSPSLSNAGGKIFLANNSTTVTFTAPNTVSGNVVDFVGYGTGNTYEGTAAAPTPTSTATALVRAGGGCTDNNTNSTDFANATSPAPRNMSTTLAPCGGSPTPQEINVQVAGTSFASGSTYSGFASTAVGGNNVKTFTIQNTGGTALTVSAIALSGTNAADYAVSALTPSSPVAANGSATFTVTFSPSAAGTRTAVLTITNNDSDEGSYVVNLSAVGTTGTPNPEINVQVGGVDYLSGTSTYAFGTTQIGTPVNATFTVQNTSSTDVLTVSSQAVTGSSGAGFSLSSTTGYTVAPNSTATFTATFNPTSNGSKTGTITINSDDQDEAAYTIALTGTAATPPSLTAASASTLLVGVPSVVIFSGTNFVTTAGGTTVNYTGGTVTNVTVGSSTFMRATLTPSSTTPGTVSVTTASGTSNTLPVSATTPPTTSGIFEPFESVYQSSYITTETTLALSSGSVKANGLLLSNTAFPITDKRNNSQSARIRPGGYLEFASTNGVGTISLQAATFGTQSATSPSFVVSYSTDGGSTYTIVAGTPAVGALTATLTTYGPYNINRAGNVLVRIAHTAAYAGSNSPQVNVDDVITTSYTAPNLTVSTGMGIPAGEYNNITVTGSGDATLDGSVVVNGAFLVQSGGILTTDCTNTITGPGSFTLAAGATLSICDPAGITSSGNTGAIQVAGTRSFSNAANYEYRGTTAQVTGSGLPSQVLSLYVGTNGNLTLSSALGVAGRLSLINGTLITGNQLTLLSSATGTAAVGQDGGSISGTVTVQRYINPSLNAGAGYRHFSSPVQSTTFADLTTSGFTPVLNTTYNTSPTPNLVTPFPNVFGYNEARVLTSPATTYTGFDKGWFVPTGNMEQGRGYSVNIPASQVVDFVGTLEFGDVDKSLSLQGGPEGGWHLLGNPYAAPLDMSTVSVPAGINAAIYVFRSTSQYGGNYRSYVNGVGGNPIVSVAQGFFVRTNTDGAVFPMSFANTTSVAPASQDVFQRNTTKPLVQLNLRDAANTLSDEAYVYFEQGATAGFDARFDAEKLPNTTGLNLATSTGSSLLAINGLPVLSGSVIVPLTVNAPAAGTYVLEAAQLANLAAGTTVTLRDALTGTRTVLAAGSSYRFTLAGTSAVGRFSLEFQPAAAPLATAAQALAAQVQVYPNPASGSFQLTLPLAAKGGVASLTNALGQTVLTRTLTGTEVSFDVRNIAAGVYNLHLTVEGTKVVRRVVVK